MTQLTDKNIEFYCPECQYMAVGRDDMLQHVRGDHPTLYNAAESERFVQIWIEDAHIEQAEQMLNYWKDQKMESQIDKAIEADQRR